MRVDSLSFSSSTLCTLRFSLLTNSQSQACPVSVNVAVLLPGRPFVLIYGAGPPRKNLKERLRTLSNSSRNALRMMTSSLRGDGPSPQVLDKRQSTGSERAQNRLSTGSGESFGNPVIRDASHMAESLNKGLRRPIAETRALLEFLKHTSVFLQL